MKIVVGLGNPGEKYKWTRHNAGFLVLEALKSRMLDCGSEVVSEKMSPEFEYKKKFEAEICEVGEALLAKPQTFMNRSGDSVSNLVNYYKVGLEDFYLIHDDLDIKLGVYKIAKAKGPKVHRGVDSVEEALGSKDFWRVRVGVDSRHQEVLNSKFEIRSPRARARAPEGFRYETDLSDEEQGRLKIERTSNENKGLRIPGEKYVLMRFGGNEREIFDKVVGRIVNELAEIVV